MSKQIDNIPPTTLQGRGFNVATMGECKTCDGDGKIFTKGNTKGGKCKCCMGTKFDLVLLQQPAARDYVETSYDIIDVIKYLLHKGGAEIGFIQKYALIRWQNVSFIISDYFIDANF